MVEQGGGGRIVCLSSVHAYQAWKDWTAYGVAKAGLRRLVKGLAIDLQGTGITANCIAPGAIANALPDEADRIDGPDRSRLVAGTAGSCVGAAGRSAQ